MNCSYIIESLKTRRWYIGSTSDLDQRVVYHNKGWNRSTNGRGPWKTIFIRQFETIEDARDFELTLKRLRNRARIRKKFRDYFL